MPNWLKLAQDAYESSTSYFDTNYRKKIEYSLRAFQNEHAPGSKYNSEDYKARSRIFRPKTRTIIRKNEAAANIALFSNPDVLVIGAEDTDNAYAVASSEVMKYVMQYRLTKTLPWFKLCMGSLQDAQSVGIVCSYQYWDYKQKTDSDGMTRIVKDEPCIKLRPIENIRFDLAADWLDPVSTSPFFIDIIPMYVCDVKAMMQADDPKTGMPKWKKADDAAFKQARPDTMDTTRNLRQNMPEDPYEEDRELIDHETVWVMKYFMREGDTDYCFYTLGTQFMLTDAKPIEEVYWHGKRPYVIGCAVIEAHKALPDGVAQLTRPLQQEANEIANQRLDNVKLVLNKRWFVARGRQVDTASLLRNVPGGVTFMNDPNLDVKESNWPDVTSSAYMEQDRLNVDFDELVGNFSGSSVMTNRQLNETVGGMRMLSQGASVMTEYLIRTWIETWVEPVLRQLMLLEQYYETNQVILGIAGKKAQLFPKFGISQVTDQLLTQELTLTVNVGQGATDPQARLQKFITATGAAINIVNTAPPGFNVGEAIKEIYSYSGFRDGSRFFSNQVDPRVPKLMQMVNQLGQQLQGKQMEMQADAALKNAEIQSNERIKSAEIAVNADRIKGDLQIRAAEISIQQAELELEKMKLAVEVEGATQEQQMKLAEAAAKIEEAKLKLEHEAQRIAHDALKLQADLAKNEQEMRLAQNQEQVQAQSGEVVQQVNMAMKSLDAELSQVRSEIANAREGKKEMDFDSIKKTMEAMANGLVSVADSVSKLKSKPQMVGYKVQKGQDGKRTGIMVSFDDGSNRLFAEH
jgi:hypothetical protein